jgi:carnitine 3-dehydrogenase
MSIDLVAIVGTGVIGAGWASRLLANGKQVVAFDPVEGFGENLTRRVEASWPILEKKGLAPGANLKNLTCVSSLEEACQHADLIQENAPENIDVKKAVHKDIERYAKEDAIIASSSSGLLPTEIQSVYQFPQRLIIAHPFNPVYMLPLVELVGGEQTAASTIENAKKFYTEIGMKPLHVRKEIEGYLSDRLQEALWREILHLVNDDIATTGELDDAIIYGPGLRWAIMGTCMTFHLAGGENGMRHMLEQFGPALKLPWTKLEAPELTDSLIDKMVTGTAEQAGDASIDELEKLRDNCLLEIMGALEKFQVGAGALKAK